MWLIRNVSTLLLFSAVAGAFGTPAPVDPEPAVLCSVPAPPEQPLSDAVTFTGRVSEFHHGRPLHAAQVWIDGTSRGTLTNAQGEYSVSVPRHELPVHPTLVVQLIGFREGRRALPVASDSRASHLRSDFGLHEQALVLESIVVNGAAAGTPTRKR